MPIYEFRCLECGDTKEILVRTGPVGGPPMCDPCGLTMTRLISAPAVEPSGRHSYEAK